MKNQSKIIKFPANRSQSRKSRDDFYGELDDIEEWEIYAELREKEDYPGLVRYCRQRAQRFPDDPYAQYYLGEAYVLNGEYEKAIQFLSKHHGKHPDVTDFQHVILDALFALGKTEDDFKWTEKPVILRMSKDIVNFCYEFLKPKKKPRSVGKLYMEFIPKGYVLFKEEDLFKALAEDERFIVDDSDDIFTEVKVVRKKRRNS